MHVSARLIDIPPKQVITFAPHKPSFHVHDTAFNQFFSVMTPYSITKGVVCYCIRSIRSIVCYTAESLFTFAKDTTLKVNSSALFYFYQGVRSDAFVSAVRSTVSFFLKDIGYDEKIRTLRQHIERKTATDIYSELETFLTSMAVSSIKKSLLHAPGIDPDIAPPWILKSIVTKERAYTLKGKLALRLVQQHEALIVKAISYFVLKVLSNLIDSLQMVQSENPFALLDLILSALNIAPSHFNEAKAQESAEMKAGFKPQQPAIQEALKQQFFKSLSDAILRIILPKGAKEFELPVSSTLNSYLSSSLFSSFKSQVLPDLLQEGFERLSDPAVKNAILAKLFKAMHKGIDLEHEQIDQQAVKMLYPRLNELAVALNSSVNSFLEYTDPTFVPWIVKNLAPQAVANGAAKAIVEKLEAHTLQDVLILAIKKLLAKLKHVTFITTLAEKQEHKQQEHQESLRVKNQANEAKIRHYVSTIGRDPKGLVQLAQNKLFLTSSFPKPAASKPNPESVGIVSTVASYAVSAYQSASQNVVYSALWLGDVSRRIQSINSAVLLKMGRPEHELIVYDISKCVVTFLGYKGNFPELRDARFLA